MELHKPTQNAQRRQPILGRHPFQMESAHPPALPPSLLIPTGTSFPFRPFPSPFPLPTFCPPPPSPPRFTRDDGSLLLAHFLQPTKKEGRAQIRRPCRQFPPLLHFSISASSKGAMRLLEPPLIGPIGSLALLASPTLAPSSSSHPLLPPFNARDSRLVASCALRAQQKQRQNQNEGQGTRAWSLWARLGMGPGQSPPPVHGLPIRQVRYDHPHRRGALFCRTGNWLELVEGEGGDRGSPVKVQGTRRQSGRFTVFEFLAVAFGLVSIRASANQHFLCMDANGQLYAAPESQYSAECVFMEEMHPQVYNLYSSCAHGPPRRPWFVALSKTGRPRRGRGTRRGQKSAHFVLVEGRGGENGGEGGRNKGGGGNANAVLDSLGHAQSRADWLVHWRNFYEVHERRKKKRPPPASAKGRSGRLRWEIETGSELRRRRRIGVG